MVAFCYTKKLRFLVIIARFTMLLDKLHIKSNKVKVFFLYFAAVLVRGMAFIRYYALSHFYGISEVTDTYMFYLFVLESLVAILVSNHVLTLFMRYFDEAQKSRRSGVVKQIFSLVSALSLILIFLTDLILAIWFKSTASEILFLSVAGYFFIMSVAMISILNYLKFFEAAAYQDIIGQFILLLGIVFGNRYILYGSILIFAIVRFVMFYFYLYKSHYIVSVKKLVSEGFWVLYKFGHSKQALEIFYVIAGFLISTLSGFYQAHLVKVHGVGTFTAFSYAGRVIRAASSIMLVPLLPIFARHLIDLRNKYKKRKDLIIKKLVVYSAQVSVVLSVALIVLALIGKPLLRIFLLHGNFSISDFVSTYSFYKALLVTVITFNIMAFLIQVLLVFTNASEVFWAYLWSSITFILTLSLLHLKLGIVNVQFWAFLTSGIIFVLFSVRAIMKYLPVR